MKRALTLSTIALALAFNAFAGEFPEISIPDVKAAINSKQVTLLDANGTGTWKRGHIPGAIDYTTHQKDLASVLPKDKNALIVAYCGGPRCRAYESAAKAAQKLGYKNVKHLVAGISGWQESGQQVEKSS